MTDTNTQQQSRMTKVEIGLAELGRDVKHLSEHVHDAILTMSKATEESRLWRTAMEARLGAQSDEVKAATTTWTAHISHATAREQEVRQTLQNHETRLFGLEKPVADAKTEQAFVRRNAKWILAGIGALITVASELARALHELKII